MKKSRIILIMLFYLMGEVVTAQMVHQAELILGSWHLNNDQLDDYLTRHHDVETASKLFLVGFKYEVFRPEKGIGFGIGFQSFQSPEKVSPGIQGATNAWTIEFSGHFDLIKSPNWRFGPMISLGYLNGELDIVSLLEDEDGLHSYQSSVLECKGLTSKTGVVIGWVRPVKMRFFESNPLQLVASVQAHLGYQWSNRWKEKGDGIVELDKNLKGTVVGLTLGIGFLRKR